MMSARQVLIRALREQLGKGGGAVVAFAVGAAATAGLAALTGPALASLDPASINDPIAPTGPLGGLHLSAPQVLLAAVALVAIRHV